MAKEGVRIPIVGPLLAANFLILLMVNGCIIGFVGTALFCMLGKEFLYPVLGTLLGGQLVIILVIYCYTLFRGGGLENSSIN